MGRDAWRVDPTANLSRWDDYDDYKQSRADELGLSGVVEWDWHDPNWWIASWIDPIAAEYGWTPAILGGMDLPTLWKYKTAIDRRKDREGYIAWLDQENAKAESGEKIHKNSNRPAGMSKKEWADILAWSNENADNFKEFMLKYAGYVPGQ